jgi:hypothetical protein
VKQRHCLFAHTPTMYPGGYYPPYVNLSEEGGELVLTVRSERKADGHCGDSATMHLSREVAENLRQALAGHLMPAERT